MLRKQLLNKHAAGERKIKLLSPPGIWREFMLPLFVHLGGKELAERSGVELSFTSLHTVFAVVFPDSNPILVDGHCETRISVDHSQRIVWFYLHHYIYLRFFVSVTYSDGRCFSR